MGKSESSTNSGNVRSSSRESVKRVPLRCSQYSCRTLFSYDYLRSSVMCSSEPMSPARTSSGHIHNGFQCLCNLPPRVLIGGPAVCCTCVIILAAPPAVAMTYVNDSSGLDPSVYGGGGSPSSMPPLEDSPFVSFGRAAFVCAAALDSASSSARASSKEGAGAVINGISQMDSVTAALIRLSSASGGK